MSRASLRRGEAGLGLVPALFLLIVMALAGAMMIRLSGVQHASAALGLHGARAYHAARSGIEWGARQALVGGSCAPATAFAVTEGGITGFNLQVSCANTQHTESGSTSNAYEIVSVAEYGTFGSRDYVRRRLRAALTDAP